MTTKGWIKVDKEIYRSFARDKDRLRYMDLLLMSDHIPYTHRTKSGTAIEVRTGEFVVSQKKLAKDWNCSPREVNVLFRLLTETGVLRADNTDYHEQKYTFTDRVGNVFFGNDKRNDKMVVSGNDKIIVSPTPPKSSLTDCKSAGTIVSKNDEIIVSKNENGNDKNTSFGNDKRNDIHLNNKTIRLNNNNNAHMRAHEEESSFKDFIELYNGQAEKAGKDYRIRAATPEREALYTSLSQRYDRQTIAEAIDKALMHTGNIGIEWFLKEENFVRILEGTYKPRHELKLKRNETVQDKRRGVEPPHPQNGGYRFK